MRPDAPIKADFESYTTLRLLTYRAWSRGIISGEQYAAICDSINLHTLAEDHATDLEQILLAVVPYSA